MIDCHGISNDNELVFRLTCGHLVAYPLDKVEAIITLEAGFILHCAACPVSEVVEPEDMTAVLEKVRA